MLDFTNFNESRIPKLTNEYLNIPSFKIMNYGIGETIEILNSSHKNTLIGCQSPVKITFPEPVKFRIQEPIGMLPIQPDLFQTKALDTGIRFDPIGGSFFLNRW